MDIKGLRRKDREILQKNYLEYIKQQEELDQKKSVIEYTEKELDELNETYPITKDGTEHRVSPALEEHGDSISTKETEQKDLTNKEQEEKLQLNALMSGVGNPLTPEEQAYYNTLKDEDVDMLTKAIRFIELHAPDINPRERIKDLWRLGAEWYNQFANNPFLGKHGIEKLGRLTTYNMIPGVGYALGALDIANNLKSDAEDMQHGVAMHKALLDDSYVRDAFSSWVQKKNAVEVETYAGNILRNDEKKTYAKTMYDYMGTAIDLMDTYNRIQKGDSSIATLQKFRDLLSQLDSMKEDREVANSYNLDDSMYASYMKRAEVAILDGFLNRVRKNDLISDKQLAEFRADASRLQSSFEDYIKELDEKTKEDFVGAQKNIKELREWEQWHTISDDYLKNEKLAQENLLSELDTYVYGMPGVMGSSASFNGTQLLGMFLNTVGQGLMMAKNPYVAGAGLVSTLAGAGTNIISGENENDAEVASNYKNGLTQDLRENGIYDDFIEDGKQLLDEKGIYYKDDDEVMTYFLLKRWFPNSKRAKDIAVNRMFGAQNMFERDMVATTADVLIDTGLSIFAPYGPLSKTARLSNLPKKEVLKRWLSIKYGGTTAETIENFTKETGVGRSIADAISPVLGGAYRAARAAATPLTRPASKALEPWANKLTQHVDDAIAWTKAMPKTIAATKKTVGNTVDFAGRTLVRGFSEAVEEGKQHEYGERYANGELAGENVNILQLAMDDLSTGMNVGFLFLGHLLLGLQADKDLMAEMRGGFLGGLLNQNTLISTYHAASGTIKDVHASNVLYNNLTLLKYHDRSAIINGETFARYHTASDYDRMMHTFDDMEKVVERSYNSQMGLTRESIEQQRDEYRKIYKLANSRVMRGIAEERNIKPHSKDYNTLVGLVYYINNARNDRKKLFNDTVKSIQELLDSNTVNQDAFNNIQELLDNNFEDESLSEQQKEYLLKIRLEIIDENPGISNEDLAKNMKTHILLEREADQRLAQYMAYHQLLKELDWMQDAMSPEEYLRHSKKNKVYTLMLKTFMSDDVNKSFIESLGLAEEVNFSEARDYATNVEMYDTLMEAYRQLAETSAQLQDINSTWRSILGDTSANMIYLDEDEIESEYVTNDQLKAVLNIVRATNKRTTKGGKQALKEEIKKGEQAAKSLIDLYRNSIKSDELLIEDINRDFAERSQMRPRPTVGEMPQLEEQETDVAFNQLQQNTLDFAKSKTKSLLQQDELVDKFLIPDEDGDILAQKINDLVNEDAQVYELTDSERAIYARRPGEESDEVDVEKVEVSDKYTHVAVRKDGTLMYLTKTEADFYKYLYGLKHPESTKPKKSLYSAPETTIGEYEDDILEAILERNKSKFDRLFENIKQYVSEEKADYIAKLWSDANKDVVVISPDKLPVPSKKKEIVPVGNRQKHTTIKELREKSKNTTRKIRNVLDSVFSLVTMFGTYSQLVPSTFDENVEYLDRLSNDLNTFLDTLEEKERKSAKAVLNRKDGDSATNQQKIDLYVRAGFQITSNTKNGRTTYYAQAPTGETYKINATQYKYASWMQYHRDRKPEDSNNPANPLLPKNPVISTKPMTEKQKAAVEILRKKLAYDNPERVRIDLRTGWDYFFVEDGKLVRYNRVHSKIDPQYRMFYDWTRDYNDIVRDLTAVFDNKEEFKKKVIEYENRYNDELARIYGKDSAIYNYHKKSLRTYLLDEVITDPEIINSIAHLVAIKKDKNGNLTFEVPSRAVIAGLVIDEICRLFFAGKTVVNKPEYMLPDKYFDKLIEQLTKLKEIYDGRGWHLITDPLCWRAVVDGQRIAGETDMIAVDENGDLHIIDFKTSKYSFEEENDESIVPTLDNPDEVSTKQLIPALDNKTKSQDRTARLVYTDQLTYYANMIRADLEGALNVKTVELLCFLIRTMAGKNALDEFDDSVFAGFVKKDGTVNSERDSRLGDTVDGVELQNTVELTFAENINNLHFENSELSSMHEALIKSISMSNFVYSQLLLKLNANLEKITDQSKRQFELLRRQLEQINSNSSIADRQVYEKAISDSQALLNQLLDLDVLIFSEIEKYNLEHPATVPEKPRLNSNRKASLGLAALFNCLDIFNERFVNPELQRVSALPDFLESAIFEIDVDTYEKTRVYGGRRIATPTCYVKITYVEHLPNGSVKRHEFDKIKLLFAKMDNLGNTFDQNLDGQNVSPLLAKIESILADPNNKGKRVVLRGGSRTNGIVKYDSGSLSELKLAQDAFGITEELMETMLDGNDGNVLAIVKRGQVYKTQSGRNQLVPLHGIDPDRAMTDGTMVWYLNLGYYEDKGSGEHSIPITLTPKLLTPTDVSFIIDLLKNYTKKRKITINGREYDSPISNSRLLRSIIRFGGGATEVGNRFIFDWANKDEHGYSTDGYRTVRIAKRSEGNENEFDFDYVIDLQNDDDVYENLFPALLRLYIYSNNEYAMWHATSSKRDASNNNKNAPMTNPFVGLEHFFKTHPELTQGSEDVEIKFSDSMIFRRSDVDPKLDGSYKGITGAHWMMKNGWFITNFTKVILPMFSFTDIDVIQNNTEEQPVETPLISEESTEQKSENEEWSLNWNEDPAEFKLQFGESKVPMNRALALDHLHKILGNSFPIEFLSNAYDVLASGERVVAACKTNAIILTDEAENGVEFHEAFHAVVDLLIGENRRKRIYKIYNQKYGNNNLSEKQISEGLADLYYEFRQATAIDWHSGILNVFKQITNWISYLYNLDDVRLAWLFIQTNLGWFKNRIADPESIKSFMQRNKTGYEPYALRIGNKEVNLPSFISQRQVNDAIDAVIYRIIKSYGIDNIASNIDQLQTDKASLTQKDGKFWENYKGFTLPTVSEEAMDEAIRSGKIVNGRPFTQDDKDKVLKFRDIFEHWDELHPVIEQKLKTISIDTVLQRKKKEAEDKTGGSIVSEDIGAHSDAFYEHSRSEDVSAKIRYFLSTVPSVRWITEEDIAAGVTDINGRAYTSIYRLDKNRQIVYDKAGKPVRNTIPMSRNTLGMITFQSFNEVYQKLLKQLYDVEDVNDLLNKLEELGQEDYVFYHVKNALYNFRYRSYLRDEKGFPVVMIGNERVNPSMYISNLENPTELEMYPTVVRFSHDIEDEEGLIVHHKGEIIEDAIILTNPDYESLATQIFLAIKSQHLDFTFTYATSIVNENGEPEAGKRKYNNASTNEESGSSVYPLLWFNRLRTQSFGLIKLQDGKPVIDKESPNKDVFKNAKNFLLKLQSQFAPNRRHKMDLGQGRPYDIDNKEDFDKIETLFISHLNKIGISIDKSALNYMLRANNPNASLQESFEYIFTSNEDSSILPFIKNGGVLDQLQSAVNEGDVSKFIDDVNTKGNENANIKGRRQGSYLYSLSGFVIQIAIGASRYNTFYKDAMVIGPGNTRMYTFAENHSASDTTYELNNALDADGNTRKGNIMDDLKDVSYVTVENDGHRIGSVIAKFVLDPTSNPNHDKIVLHTHSGLKLTDSRDGGVKYAEINSREDYISKAQILRDGGIIFPTLSDKSTWFYLSGIRLPGFNWSAKTVEEFGLLPTPDRTINRLFYFNDEHLGDFKLNPVLDQMIEYTLCELVNIEKTIDDLGLNEDLVEASKESLSDNKKVKNYHTLGKKDKDGNVQDAGLHGARFFFLTGVYDERTGKYIEFNKVIKNDPDLGVVKCYKLAKQYFFDKVINPKTGKLETDEELMCRQRSQIAGILQRRLEEELDLLVELGIIGYNSKQTTYSMVRRGSTETKPDSLPKYFGYVNKMLDEADITRLAEMYDAKYKGKYGLSQCRSLAIVAYVNDILAKSIMSTEETERIYTGMPQFFKCKYDSEGHLIDRGEDESKRFGGEGSTGSNNRQDLPNMSEEYTCAEIKDWEIASSLKDTLKEAFRLDEYRDALANKLVDNLRSSGEYTLQKEKEIYDDVYSRTLEDVEKEFSKEERAIIDAKILAESQSYEGGINVADGTAYITDKMAENLLRQLGKYEGKVKEAFEYLRNQKNPKNYEKVDGKTVAKEDTRRNSYLTNAKAYRIIHQALISTQKYSAFGFRMENGVPVHFYNKFALFPLFEGISYGFTKHLYDKMNDPENPVEMVMFDSAVKSGSEGAQTFNPEMSEEAVKNFTFAGHTYKQKYKFIRRQLNTDPRTDEEMAFGTQVLKIALSTLRSGQTYTLSDGTQILGEDLKASIMRCQRQLSEIGAKKINEEFFKDGKVDVEALSKFFEDALLDRDANKNILDAIKVVEVEDGDGNKHKEFRVDLNSISSLSWIESILNSYINKEVIDVNMPGNAYYQRSVFGMEGGISVMSDDDLDQRIYLLNDGKPLQMVNEDGSMDAVISIDYFMHLIPENIRYDFKKARQFLIDNKIIGPEAETSTIAYRIPTQAVSSVHALKFVDVLPIVRDTIVLPKEFTKITGSDFDIDKLYLTSFNYKLDKKNNKITSEFEQGSAKLIQNEMMKYYMALICDAGKLVTSGKITMSRYMHMLHRSIDNDTSLITTVLKNIEKDQERPTYEPWQYASLATQVRIKNAFMVGKRGIGPFALNNNNHILTMLYNVGFVETEDGILDVIGMRSLSRSLDRDGNSILSWISAMINAHVDVAKDPYILRLNVNEYTYNLTNLMLRIGLGKDTLYFTAQPIMKELASIYENANGSLVEDPGLTPQLRYNRMQAVYVNSLGFTDVDIKSAILAYTGNSLPKEFGYLKIDDAEKLILMYEEKFKDVIKAIFSVSEDGSYQREFTTVDGKIIKGASILEDVLTNPEAKIDSNKPATMDNLSTQLRYKIGNKMYSPRDILAFVFMSKLRFDRYAEQLSNLVQFTKIDTKKQGISYQEQRTYRAAYDSIHDEYAKAAEENRTPKTLFDENVVRMMDESFIHTKTVFGTSMLRDILGNHVMYMHDNFLDIVDGIAEKIGKRSGKVKAAIQKALITYVKQKCMNRCMEDRRIDFRPMIYGTNTLASRIDALKEKMLSDTTGKYSDYVVNGNFINTLLRNIHGVPYIPPYGQDRYDLLSLDNVLSDDQKIENDYIDSWQLLLDSDDEEIRKIGDDLAIYAFMTSGDNSGFTKFFKYVPLSWRENIGYCEYMREINRAFAIGWVTLDGNINSFNNIDTEEFIRNNWTNSDIVPVMSAYRLQYKTRDEIEITGNSTPYYVKNYFSHAISYKDLNMNDQEVDHNADLVIAGIVRYKNTFRITISKRGGEFPPFIKIKRRYASFRDSDPYMLYKLVDVATHIDEQGKVYEYPIYALTYPGGFSIKALGQRFDLYECERDDEYSHIFSREAMLGDNYGDKIATICNQLEQYVREIGQLPKTLNEVLGEDEMIEIDNQGNKYYNLDWDMVLRDIVSNGSSKHVKKIYQPKIEVKGENISSYGSDFAKLLTNPGNNLTVEYKGVVFRNAEHAYQTWKSGEFDETAYNSTAFKPQGSKPANKSTNYQTMVDILTAKLQQHPELVEGIIERGGIDYLNASTHNIIGDAFWESRGLNKFMEALKQAYVSVTSSDDSSAEQAEALEVGEENVQGTIQSMESNNNPEFTEADKNIRSIIGNNPLKVVMATEHTDPVPNSQKVCRIINEDRKLPKEKRKYHMLQIMTKHDGLPLLNMLELDIPKTVHFSITGLGGTKWEPGVMKPDDFLDRIEDFIKQGKLNPSLVTVRIDPIIPGVTTPNMIKHIIERASQMGIKSFKISIMDSYSYNDKERWRRGIYEKMTLLGYDFSKYYTKYDNGNFSQDVKPELMKSIYEKVDAIAQQYGVFISTCGEKPANVNTKNIRFSLGCLNAHTVSKVLGTSEEEVNKVSEESKQRPGKCHCLNNKIDILSFDDSCFSSCAYCYAKHGSDSAYNYYNEDGTLKRNGLTMTRHKSKNVKDINTNSATQSSEESVNLSPELLQQAQDVANKCKGE